MGYKMGLRLCELKPAARGSQEAGFTQLRDYLIADPCTIRCNLLQLLVAFFIFDFGVGVVGVADGRAEHGPRLDAFHAGAFARTFAPLSGHPKGLAQLLTKKCGILMENSHSKQPKRSNESTVHKIF